MRSIRNRYLLTSAAIIGLALPTALLADAGNQSAQQDQQQSQQDRAQQASSNSNQDQNQQANDQENNGRENNSQENNSQENSGQENNSSSIRGVVKSYRTVDLDGSEHFRARVLVSNGKMITVDFGPSGQIVDLIDNLEQGDHIGVQGQSQKIDGKPVFIASSARINGQTYNLDQNGEESASYNNNNEQQNQEQNGEQANNEQNQQREMGQRGQSRPAAEILLNERFVFVNEGDLNRHVMLAGQDLAAGDTRAAAGELRAAAERLDLYANAAKNNGDVRNALEQSKQELDQLADRISNSGNKSNGNNNANNSNASNINPSEIDQAAAHAQLALAKYFQSRVQQDLSRNQPVVAGYALQAAALHAREALIWSSQTPQRQDIRCIHAALRTADDLIQGNQQQAGNVNQVADALNHDIDQIDQQSQQGQPQAQPANERQSPNDNSSSNNASSNNSSGNNSSSNNNGSSNNGQRE